MWLTINFPTRKIITANVCSLITLMLELMKGVYLLGLRNPFRIWFKRRFVFHCRLSKMQTAQRNAWRLLDAYYSRCIRFFMFLLYHVPFSKDNLRLSLLLNQKHFFIFYRSVYLHSQLHWYLIWKKLCIIIIIATSLFSLLMLLLSLVVVS